MSRLRTQRVLCIEDQKMALSMQELPEADVHSCKYIDAGFETAFDYVVLGCLSHGHTFQRHLRPSIAEAIGIRLISHRVAFAWKVTRLYG